MREPQLFMGGPLDGLYRRVPTGDELGPGLRLAIPVYGPAFTTCYYSWNGTAWESADSDERD